MVTDVCCRLVCVCDSANLVDTGEGITMERERCLLWTGSSKICLTLLD